MEIFAFILLVLFSLAGFAAIFFTTFGTLLIFIGAVLYSILTDFTTLTLRTLAVLFVIYLIGESLEYVFVILGVKKFGASNKAIVGALLGGIFGALIGVSFFGVGIIVGTFAGIFLGAFFVELFSNRDLLRSVKAGAGGVLGRIGSIVAKLFIAILMVWIIWGRFASPHLIQ
ncbi:MAG: DUF456 domain-containing protein [Candidatus Omnitrophica bacterium]|nr:DUF456 domain-containing protein [Candidatus Omnitrophota bacterium]